MEMTNLTDEVIVVLGLWLTLQVEKYQLMLQHNRAADHRFDG